MGGGRGFGGVFPQNGLPFATVHSRSQLFAVSPSGDASEEYVRRFFFHGWMMCSCVTDN